ncbi:MAG TPA: BTAD domain-containing putative transcriptional regulator [Actinomycetes bacterium]|nr:BTAD domain-containing putative transcriptional regulator [Actinomycetes bacterium]
MGIAVLGPLALDDRDTALGPRDRVVLAALTIAGGRVVAADRLADALWDGRPPPTWAKVVQGCVVRLRKALGPDAIDTTATGYRLALPADAVDAHRFELMVNRARELVVLGQPDRAAYVADEALALWRGPPLAELEQWEAARAEISRLNELRMEAEELRIEAALRSGQHRRVLAEAQSRVQESPLRERRWALLALAQYQSGRQADALRTIHQVRNLLATELGVDPGPDLVALETAILRQDPSLVVDAALREASASCPYMGLVPYDTADADAFFGRDADVAACLLRLHTAGVLAVVGPSGCGKSSLVRAGVVAALQRDGRRTVVITPGRHPLEALTALTRHTGPRPTLVVDQCEAAVGPAVDPHESARFLSALAEHAEQAPLVLALRADRLGALSANAGLARVIERGLYLLGAMTEADLRAAVDGPAHQVGLLLEPGLVDLLVRDVQGEPGALPLLSHALHRTWELREGRTLTVAGYRQTGGIREAVAQSAEAVYEQVAAEDRPLLRDLLLRLVMPSGDGEPMRSRVPRRLLAADAQHDGLIELLVGARLVTSDDGVVELAHEALARAWPRLRGWLDDDVEGQRILRHLTASADSWDAMGRPDSELYRGVRLAEALEWRRRTGPDLTPVETAFLDAGAHAEAASRQRDRQQMHRQVRINRRLRAMLAGVAVLSVAAAGAGIVAVRSAEDADRAAAAADARRVGAQALLEEDLDQALLLAAEGVRLHDSTDTRANLLAALSRSPGLIGSGRQESRLARLEVRLDGDVVAISNPDSGVTFHDSQTLGLVGTFKGGPASEMAFRPGGSHLALAMDSWSAGPSLDFDPEPVRLLDCASFHELPTKLPGMPPRSRAVDLAYDADGRHLAALLNRYRPEAVIPYASTAVIWDLFSVGNPVILRVAVDASASALALSPSGDTLYVGSQDPPSISAHSVPDGRQRTRVELPGSSLQLSPDGHVLAVADGTDVVLLDASTGQELRRLRGHSEPVTALRFSDGGAWLASGSADRTAIVWDVESGQRLEHLVGHHGAVIALAFDPESRLLYTTGADRTVLRWDLTGYSRFVPRLTPSHLPDPVLAMGSPDGSTVAYTHPLAPPGRSGPAALRFLRVQGAWSRADRPVYTGNWLTATWHPDPTTRELAAAGEDGTVTTRTALGEVVTARAVADGPVTGLDYTGDGRRLLVAGWDGVIRLVDARTLGTLSTADVRRPVLQAAVSPDGQRAFVATVNGEYAVVDLVTGTVLGRGRLGLVATAADFAPDGTRVAVTGTRGQVGLLDPSDGSWVRRPVIGHKDQTLSVAYSPRGRSFVSGGADGRAILWDGRTGDRLGTVEPSRSEGPLTATFLPDSHTVLLTTADGAIYQWDSDPRSWLEAACRIAGRNLTTAEWRESFGERPYRRTCPDVRAS